MMVLINRVLANFVGSGGNFAFKTLCLEFLEGFLELHVVNQY